MEEPEAPDRDDSVIEVSRDAQPRVRRLTPNAVVQTMSLVQMHGARSDVVQCLGHSRSCRPSLGPSGALRSLRWGP